VRVRGGGKVDIVWKDGRLTELSLQSNHAITYRVLYGDLSADARIKPGKPVVLDGTLNRIRL
jgi:hypothetical protein